MLCRSQLFKNKEFNGILDKLFLKAGMRLPLQQIRSQPDTSCNVYIEQGWGGLVGWNQ
jgi:hypothetical protein